MKASEVLQAAIEDIDAGKWVCGELHEKNFDLGPNPKEMACAVGLVSIHSGDTKTIKVSEKDIPDWLKDQDELQELSVEKSSGPNSGVSCRIYREAGIKLGDTFEVARYPKKGSPQETKDAIKYLHQAIPDTSDPEDEWSVPLKTDTKKLERQVNEVVNYNDHELSYEEDISLPEAAKKWFENALSLALKDGN